MSAPLEFQSEESTQLLSKSRRSSYYSPISLVSLGNGYTQDLLNTDEEGDDPVTGWTLKLRFIKQTASDLPIITLIPSAILTSIIWMLPPFEGLTHTGMHLLGVFLGFVVALLVSHYDVSTLVAFALGILCLSKNLMCKLSNGQLVDCHTTPGYKLAFKTIISGVSSEVVWLVFCAFHIGKAVEISGLGKRIALYLIYQMGQTPLGLAYSICLAEMVLAAFIPSNSARGGGVLMPIVTSVIKVLDNSHVNSDSNRAYLVFVAAQANLISSSLFLTGMAPNPIISTKAYHALKIKFEFNQWIVGNLVPGITCFILMPILLKFLIKPESYDYQYLKANLLQNINRLGGLTIIELKLSFILIVCLGLWSTSEHTGLDNSLVAFLAIIAMILFQVMTWDDISRNPKAWDTLFWLGGFVMMAEQLSELKITDWLGNEISKFLVSLNLQAFESTIALAIIYFLSMYLFSSATGHIVAMVGPFFEAGVRLGSPKYLLVCLMAYFSSLCCCITTYSTGTLAIYFGLGYISRKRWFSLGFLMAVFYISLYVTLGPIWWKMLHWW